MTTTPEWMQKQTQVSQSLLQQGSQALREGNIELAMAALTEAAIVLDMAYEETPEVRQLRAQAFNELGVVHQRRNELETSRNFHHQAALLCDALVEEGVTEFRGNSAATHLNLSNICAAMGDEDAAVEAIERSQALAEELLADGEDAISTMATAIMMTRASLDASRGEFEAGDTAMTRALELAEAAIDSGNKQLYVQVSQGVQQLSVLMFQGDEFERALEWGRKAEELSERAFEELGQEVVSIYIVSQINLISYNERLGNFAAAEDSLWKALEIVGNDPRLLKRGKDFYEECRKQADARLEAGGLPREEVEGGLEEILELIEEIGGLPEELQDGEEQAEA